MIGEQFGQYQIVEAIGSGGMATVYKAYQASMDRFVALKVLKPDVSGEQTFLKRFEREARMFARLEHRAIVPVYDYGNIEGSPYIAMRFIDAGTLRRLIYYQELDLASTARILSQTAEALDYAHSKGVIHRDLKPSNILIDSHGNAYLTDFGIAKMLSSTSQITDAQGVVGTPSYMSPEQCQGKHLSSASDIYSLGTILFEMLTGHPPYVADAPLTVMYKHVKDPVPSLLESDPTLPPKVQGVIMRVMAKSTDSRYPTASALAEAFRDAIDVEAYHPTPVESRPYETPGVGLPPAFPPPAPADPAPPDPAPPALDYQEYAPDIDSYQEPYPAYSEGYDDQYPYQGDEDEPVRRGGVNGFIVGILGFALLLGAIGLVLVVLSWLSDGQSSLVSTPVRPGPTLIAGGIGETPTPTLTWTPEPPTSAVPPTSGAIIEPSLTNPAPTLIPVTATPTNRPAGPTPTWTFIPLTVTPTRPPASATPTFTPTLTLTPSLTPTATASPTPTLTLTPTPVPAFGGGIVAFTRGNNQSSEVVVMDDNGLNIVAITANNFYDGEPDWSPDGGKMAFESEEFGNADIFTMSTNGANRSRLTSSPEPDRHPDYLPTAGTVIVFESGTGEAIELYTVKPDGTGLTRLTTNSYGDRTPQFSPDGTKIAYMTRQRGKWEIAILNYPAATVDKLFDCPGVDCRFPAWSPDGSKIAFNTLTASGAPDALWSVDVLSGVSVKLVEGGEDGRVNWVTGYIYFNRTGADDIAQLFRYNTGSKIIEQLTAGPLDSFGPDWRAK